MSAAILENLNTLYAEHKLDKPVILWGIGGQTGGVIEGLRSLCESIQILMIVDNFKYVFQKEYMGIPVREPQCLAEIEKESAVVLLAVNYAGAIRKQLQAYGMTEVFNLRNLEEKAETGGCSLPYHFIDRQQGQKTLCYILAGYEPGLWDNTLGRIAAFQSEEVDYCLISSGKYDKDLEELAEKNNWSYLYTEQNQVCFIQNLVVELHPQADYIIKMDEDIFIGRNFFECMLREYHRIEEFGEYRIGFAVPVIPLNCCGYVSYLKLTGKQEEYEARFGRAYRSRFSAVFNVEETAEFLWDTMDTFDAMAESFLQNKESRILDCYYNIGCILFSRERWLMMGKWPENPGESGMGTDEAYIYQDNVEKDLSIYEIQSVLAGHLAFGHQKERMRKYYREHQAKFKISNRKAQ